VQCARTLGSIEIVSRKFIAYNEGGTCLGVFSDMEEAKQHIVAVSS
jgi:hypothetical protein